MGQESQIDALNLSPLAQRKIQELVALLADEGFGAEGPARDTTFATIEAFGHQAGRKVAWALDEHLTPRRVLSTRTDLSDLRCTRRLFRPGERTSATDVRWRSDAIRTGLSLPDLSAGFFSLSGPLSNLTAARTVPPS